jgi:hypothetical protein
MDDTEYQDPSSGHRQCRVEGVRLPVRIAELARRLNVGEGYFTDSPLAQACQLRRLYQLFGCDHATWEEVVAIEKVDEGVDAPVGRSEISAQFMDCACDYP